jgi:glycosyltransferase involved in cell wall biosynthesis
VYPSANADPAREDDRGVQVWRLREAAVAGGWAAARFSLYRTVRRWGREGEVDLIEVPDWSGWSAGWQGLRVPVIVRLHGSATYFGAELGQRVPAALRLLEWLSLKGADFRCSVSRYTAERTEKLFALSGGAAEVLYNPVELPPPASRHLRSRTRVIYTGTLTEKKGVVSLARAWPAVLEQVPDAELHMYGKDGPTLAGGSMQAYLRELLGSAGSSVTWHGHVARPQLLEALRTARAAVFPSYVESLGMAPLEAMACGCPTVYSRRGPGPELADDERQALLIDPDDPAGIAHALVRLCTDDELAARLGDAARVRVSERFSLEKLVSDNESFYRTCLVRAVA